MENGIFVIHILFICIRVIVVCIGLNFFYRVAIRWYRQTREFSKLPRLPIIGPIGWFLGNLDVYYYTMRHLDVEEGKSQF